MPRHAPRIDTPVGAIHVSVSADGSVRVDWEPALGRPCMRSATARARRCAAPDLPTADGRELDCRAAEALAAVIGRWIQGDAAALRHAPLPRGTPWQVACWRAARRIPHGQVRTYLWLAREACRTLGRPASAASALARAAGQAMRRNPAPIVVPCHRVVSASGLGGYAGTDDLRSPSLARKRWLLALESRPEMQLGRHRSSTAPHTQPHRARPQPVDSPPRRTAGNRRL